MKKNNTLFCTLLLLLFTTLIFAQETPVSNPSIDQQFDELLENSNNFKQYKVVKEAKLIELQKNTRGKIEGLKKEIVASKSNIEAQQKKIAEINTTLSETTKNLKEATKAKEEIAFFGIPTTKSTYRIITWGIVLILLAALISFIYKFRSSHILTKEAQKDLQETKDEFDEYRKSALEKQQKLGRTLQDERNKLLRHTENRSS